MLYVFYGTDIAQAGNKARALVDSLRAKRPDAAYEKIDGDSWDESALQGHLGGQGLFSSKYIVFLDRVTENAEAKDVLSGYVPAMQESANIFILLEGKLHAELKKAVEKSAEKIVEIEKKALSAFGAGEPNVFAIASSFGGSDRLKTWRVYREAVDRGVALEAVIGMLFWKAKTGMDAKLARELVALYHDGHRGLRDLELATERLILSQ